MESLTKEQLKALRKVAGYGYAAGVEKILLNELDHKVEKIQHIYDAAHGKNKDEKLLQGFLTYVIRKSKASSAIQTLAGEALKLITPTQAA